MAFVSLTVVGISPLTERKTTKLGQQMREAATSCLSTSEATIGTGELKLHPSVKEQEEATLPRIEVEVSVPYHPSREVHLLPLANVLASMTGQHYSNVRVVMYGKDGGPKMQLALRSNYPRE